MPKKKKKVYVNILDLPLEYLTGWQEVGMDLDKIRAKLELARTAVEVRKSEPPAIPASEYDPKLRGGGEEAPKKKKKKKYRDILQAVPMDPAAISASFDATLKKE